VDASYGTHKDRKSQTGAILTMGIGAINAKSSKQKIVAKSSTEAELIAASDQAGDLIESSEFLRYQGYDIDIPEVLEDNTSTIRLITNGRKSSERTKHVDIRYFWLEDKVKNNIIKIIHTKTEEMIADLLTKALQGSQFKYLSKLILGVESKFERNEEIKNSELKSQLTSTKEAFVVSEI
jgi:hypothetical protein